MTDENESLSANDKIARSLPHSDSRERAAPTFTKPIRADVLSSTALESMLIANSSVVKSTESYLGQLEADLDSGSKAADERAAGLTSLNVQTRKQVADAEKKKHRQAVLENSKSKRHGDLQQLNSMLAAVESAIATRANSRAMLNQLTILDPGMTPIQAQIAVAGEAAITDYVQLGCSILRDSNALESEKQRARCLLSAACAKLDADRDLAKRLGWSSSQIADEAIGPSYRALRLRLELLRIQIKRQQHRILDLERGRKNIVMGLELAMAEKVVTQKYGTAK